MTNEIKVEVLLNDKNDSIIRWDKEAGENIQMIRKYCRITQKELASLIGTNPKRIMQFEKGQMYPNVNEAYKICEALQVSYLALFFKIRIKEKSCDSKTGLSAGTIECLTQLNRKNSKFIKLINQLHYKPQMADMICELMEFSKRYSA